MKNLFLGAYDNNVVKFILIGFIWGLNFPASKFSIEKIGVWNFRLITSIAALIVLLALFRNEFSKKYLERKSDLLKVSLLAVPNVFLVPTLNSFSLLFSNSSTSLILIYSMPCIVSIFSMIHMNKFNFHSTIAVILTVISIYSIVYGYGFGFGEAIIIISAFVWAVGTFLTGIYKTSLPTTMMTTLQFIVSFVLVLVTYVFVDHDFQILGGELLSVLVAVCVGIFGSAFVFHLWFSLIKQKGAEYVSYSSLLSLVFGLIFSNIILKESITLNLIFSLCFILIAVWLVNFRKISNT